MPLSYGQRGALVPAAEGLLRLRSAVTQAAVSVDGRYAAWTPADEARRAEVVVTDLATGDEVVRFAAGTSPRFVWCSPGHLLVMRRGAGHSRATLHEMPDGGAVGECALPCVVSENDRVETSRDGRLVCFHETMRMPSMSYTHSLPDLDRVGEAARDSAHGLLAADAVALHPEGRGALASVSYARQRSVVAFLSTRDGVTRSLATLPAPYDACEPDWVEPDRLALTVGSSVLDTVLVERPDAAREVSATSVAGLVGRRDFAFARLAVSSARPALLGVMRSSRSRETRSFAVVDVSARALLACGASPRDVYGAPSGCFTEGGGAAVVAVPTTRGTAVMLLDLDRAAARVMELPAARLAPGALLDRVAPPDFVPLLESAKPLAPRGSGVPSKLFLLSLEALRAQGTAVGPGR